MLFQALMRQLGVSVGAGFKEVVAEHSASHGLHGQAQPPAEERLGLERTQCVPVRKVSYLYVLLCRSLKAGLSCLKERKHCFSCRFVGMSDSFGEMGFDLSSCLISWLHKMSPGGACFSSLNFSPLLVQ